MPLVPVDTKGTVLNYIESGVPNGSSDYTTAVLIHGIFFNGATFTCLFPYASKHNLRLVSVDARDNGSSTLYNETELKAITGKNKPTQTEFVKDRVLELANFLAWFIEHERVPPVTIVNGKQVGGISLIAWSGGNALAIPFFAFADVIPEKIRATLEPYLRSYVIYDPAFLAIGARIPTLDELYSEIRDPMTTDERKANLFLPIVCGYYTHHSPSCLRAFSATSLSQLPDVPSYLKALQDSFDKPLEVDPGKLASAYELEGLWRSAMPILLFDSTIYEECFNQLLVGDANGRKYFPNVRVEGVTCEQTVPDCMYGLFVAKQTALQFESEGKELRKIGFHVAREANHFFHWVEPERALKLFAELV